MKREGGIECMEGWRNVGREGGKQDAEEGIIISGTSP